MVVSGQSIIQELAADVCDVAELEQVIGTKLGGWGGDRNDPRALLFPGDQEAYAINLFTM